MPFQDPETERAYKAAWYQKNRERLRRQQAQAYRDKQPQRLAKQAEYRDKHREELRQKALVYYEANRATIRHKEAIKRQSDPEECRAKKRAAYHAARAAMAPEQLAEERRKMRELYHRNREQKREIEKRYRKRHPEKVKEAQRKSVQRNLAHYRIKKVLQTNRRRAWKQQAAINDFTPEQWITLQAVFIHCCAYCGQYAKGTLTQDHITPLSQGGNHTLSNIVPACRACNRKKHTGPPLAPVQPLLL